MIVKRANKMGFCFGVEGAVNLCTNLISDNKKYKNSYILGMLVHNKTVIKDLTLQGYKILKEEDILKDSSYLTEEDLIVIRAHGTTKEVYEVLNKTGASIHDATCIFVKRIRDALIEAEKNKDEIIFIGDEFHPEVRGIISFGKNIHIFPSFKDFASFKIDKSVNYTLLTQTTFNKEEFFKIKDYVVENFSNIKIFSKICGATYERQRAVEDLARECDLVIIVGDLSSSNSKKLCELSKLHNEKSYLVQDLSELKDEWFKNISSVGLTAGASTPEKLIIDIEKYIRGNFDGKCRL